VNVVGEIQRENVSSISLPLRPKGRKGLVLAPWSGAPNQSMVGGPPSHSAIKRGWGPRLAVRGSPLRHTPHPTNPNPTRGSTGAARSSATAAAEAFLLDPRTQCHRPTLDRIVRDTAVPEPALLPCVKPRPPLRPQPARWRPTPHLRPTSMVCAPISPLFFY
jgi:hypothetical protein